MFCCSSKKSFYLSMVDDDSSESVGSMLYFGKKPAYASRNWIFSLSRDGKQVFRVLRKDIQTFQSITKHQAL